MGTLGLKSESKPATQDEAVSLGKLSELTGFPVDFIKRELLLDSETDLSVEELRAKVLSYLDSSF
jgi:predicted HTH domain antitoxin